MNRAYGTTRWGFTLISVFHTHSLVEATHIVATDLNPLYESLALHIHGKNNHGVISHYRQKLSIR